MCLEDDNSSVAGSQHEWGRGMGGWGWHGIELEGLRPDYEESSMPYSGAWMSFYRQHGTIQGLDMISSSNNGENGLEGGETEIPAWKNPSKR